jgi:hypothetical protein
VRTYCTQPISLLSEKSGAFGKNSVLALYDGVQTRGSASSILQRSSWIQRKFYLRDEDHKVTPRRTSMRVDGPIDAVAIAARGLEWKLATAEWASWV